MIGSVHSHAGQDLVGVWGGVPNEYLDLVKAQAVAAIVAAYDAREPATLRSGRSAASSRATRPRS